MNLLEVLETHSHRSTFNIVFGSIWPELVFLVVTGNGGRGLGASWTSGGGIDLFAFSSGASTPGLNKVTEIRTSTGRDVRPQNVGK